MATVVLTKDDAGKIAGLTETDQRAYARFRRMLSELRVGATATLKFWVPRSPKFHRLHFAMLKALFDAQEQFADPDELRAWLQVGAGHCEFVPGPKGRMVALPKSISYERLDDAEFSEHHEKVKAFLRSEHALRFLYPHLDEAKASEMIETLLADFEEK